MNVEIDARAVGEGLLALLKRRPELMGVGLLTGEMFLHERAATELLLDWADGQIEDWGNASLAVKQRAAALSAFIALLRTQDAGYQKRTWRVPANLPPEDQARRALALEIRGKPPPERSLLH